MQHLDDRVGRLLNLVGEYQPLSWAPNVCGNVFRLDVALFFELGLAA